MQISLNLDTDGSEAPSRVMKAISFLAQWAKSQAPAGSPHHAAASVIQSQAEGAIAQLASGSGTPPKS